MLRWHFFMPTCTMLVYFAYCILYCNVPVFIFAFSFSVSKQLFGIWVLRREPFKLNLKHSCAHSFWYKTEKNDGTWRRKQAAPEHCAGAESSPSFVLMLFRQLDSVTNQFQITYNQHMNLWRHTHVINYKRLHTRPLVLFTLFYSKHCSCLCFTFLYIEMKRWMQ